MLDTYSRSSSFIQPVCTVRSAELGDCDRIAELAGQLGYHCTAQQIRTRLAEMQDPTQYAVYVAQLQDGKIAGWVAVYIFRAVELDRCAEITGLIVDERIRSRGIGKALLDVAETWARICACCAIAVHSNLVRDHAHRFYKNNAYQLIKTQRLFLKRLD